MGACASVPKDMRGEATATAAPAPELPKEDVPPVKAKASEKKGDDVKDKKEEDSDNYDQSLGKLLEEEGESSKEVEASSSSESTKVESFKLTADQFLVSKPTAPVTPKGEKTTHVTPLPISEPVAPVTPKVEETSTIIPPMVEAAAKDEMKTEATQ